MYYHILIQTGTDKLKNVVTKIDSTLEYIQSEYIEPYVKGESILINGHIFNPKIKPITRLLVTKSIGSAQNVTDSINKSVGYSLSYPITKSIAAFITDRPELEDVTTLLIKEAQRKFKLEEPATKTRRKSNKFDNTKVFIVHGHDKTVKSEVAKFLLKIQLTPIILHEQANSGQTIIEKIETNSDVGFGVVLYTACDIGQSKNEAGKPNQRARQNVVFEHGYLIAKLGRKRVCALVNGNIEKPSDIDGVIYTVFDEHDAWHIKLVKELEACGYKIDRNLI